MSNKYIEKARKSLAVGVNVESKLIGKASEKGADRAIIIAYTIASLGLAIFLGGIGIGLMFWLMK